MIPTLQQNGGGQSGVLGVPALNIPEEVNGPEKGSATPMGLHLILIG